MAQDVSELSGVFCGPALQHSGTGVLFMLPRIDLGAGDAEVDVIYRSYT